VTEHEDLTSTQRAVREAPTDRLTRTRRVYAWVRNVTFAAMPAFVIAGIWHDARWFATAIVVGVVWLPASHVYELLDEELRRRAREDAAT
jgi:hypothetical protein